MADMEKTTSDLDDMHVEDAPSDRRILIAVDFGTTFSGVAWAQTRRVRVCCMASKLVCETNKQTARRADNHYSMARCKYRWP